MQGFSFFLIKMNCENFKICSLHLLIYILDMNTSMDFKGRGVHNLAIMDYSKLKKVKTLILKAFRIIIILIAIIFSYRTCGVISTYDALFMLIRNYMKRDVCITSSLFQMILMFGKIQNGLMVI